MKIRILSDLHIEFCDFEPPPADCDVVVLAGDIAPGAQGIAWARATWPQTEIVFVPGNHEYYRSEIGVENELMAAAGAEHGVHVLNRKEVVIGGVRFLGAVLWTDFLLFGRDEQEHAMLAGHTGLSDFRVIDYGARSFTPQDSAELNRQDVAWLQARLLDEPFPGQTVVVTHHLPSMRSVPERYRESLLSACFASRLDRLMGHSALWIHGHTHDSFDYQLNGTRVICNPRGYCKVGQAPENPWFDSTLTVDLAGAGR